jgi:hypothetical protein
LKRKGGSAINAGWVVSLRKGVENNTQTSQTGRSTFSDRAKKEKKPQEAAF